MSSLHPSALSNGASDSSARGNATPAYARGVWGPGVRWLSRMPFSTKALLISLIFVIPVLVLGSTVQSDFMEKRSVNRAELDGVRVLRTVAPLNGHLLEYFPIQV